MLSIIAWYLYLGETEMVKYMINVFVCRKGWAFRKINSKYFKMTGKDIFELIIDDLFMKNISSLAGFPLVYTTI